VVHAGEVHDDGRGFYGDDLDVAFRLLDSPAVKRALREASASPLVLVVSEEIFTGIVRHGYVEGGRYEQRVQVRVGERRRRGRVHVPLPPAFERPVLIKGGRSGPVSGIGAQPPARGALGAGRR
jgi:hypothetical protein